MSILYPAMAMMALTLACILRLGIVRAGAIRAGEIDPRFFAAYRGYDEPEKLAVCSRHVINHFETPVLFYAISIIAFVSGQDGTLIVGLAWLYVALRAAHSYVHLTRNVIRLRFRLFAMSVLVIFLMWALVLAGLLPG